MAVNRGNQPTKIKVHRNESDMTGDATGDLVLLYETAAPVILDYGTYNELYVIEIFQDANNVLHGLFKRR